MKKNTLIILALMFCFSISWAQKKPTAAQLQAACAELGGTWKNNVCVDNNVSNIIVESESIQPVAIESDSSSVSGIITLRQIEPIPEFKSQLPNQPTNTLLCGTNAINTVFEGEPVCECKELEKGAKDKVRWSCGKDTVSCEGPTGEAAYCKGPPVSTTVAASTETIDCISNLEADIRTCDSVSKENAAVCDNRSEKAKTMQDVINGTSGQITAALANSGSADSCSKAGLLSSTAGYGAGMLANDCKTEIKKCQDACDGLAKYSDVDKIKERCAMLPGETIADHSKKIEALSDKFEELAQLVANAEDTCASTQRPTKAQTFLNNSIGSATRFAELSQTSATCANAISGKASVVPLTVACAMGTGVNCPVNCVTNPGDASCKTVSGTASQLAAIASKPNQYIPSGFGAGKIPTGGVDLGNVDLGNDSGEASATTQPTTDAESAALFASAAQANAGGGGSTSASDKKDKAGSGGEATEDKGFFGGTFSAMKNAVNRAIGGSGFFGGKNSSSSSADSKIDVTKKKSIIRGLANTGGATCYMDAKGSEFCFGRKNMDIFQMMNKQYNNQHQRNTFIAH